MYFDPSVSVEEKIQRYLQFGGMPTLCEYKFNEARANLPLEGIYSNVVLHYNFGVLTKAEVLSFQCKHHLAADAIVDSRIRVALKKAL